MLSDSAILKHIAKQPKRAAGFKQLVRELGVRGEDRRELDALLQKMVAQGTLISADGDRYALPSAAADKNLVAGRLSMHRDGFGFVIPDSKSLNAGLRARLTGDIFIPPHVIGNAMHGDLVLVEILNVRPDGRAEGRIVRPVRRAHPTVVGIFHYGARRNYVTPMDAKITQEIVIPEGMEWPQKDESGEREIPRPAGENAGLRDDAASLKAGPRDDTASLNARLRDGAASLNAGLRDDATHEAESSSNQKTHKSRKRKSVDRVLGEEAARASEWTNLEGLVVDVEITDWPSATQNPRGKVTEILGREDDFGVDVEIVIRKFHLPHHFPAATLEEAQRTPAVISSVELARRKDYRSLPIVTIDGETARDFDDAVLVRKLDSGNYELQVHIADVAQYVTPGSALDQEARLRGTSVYFPDRAVPMLPLELSTDICSLRPQVDRLVMSCVMEIDGRGDVLAYELSEGVIRSAERMTYTAVNAVLENDAAMRSRYAPLVESFERMRDLAVILNNKRKRRGSIDFDLPEPVIEFDEFGLMKSIGRSERNFAHRLIEEFMLAANECVAGHLEAKGIASLYRVHEKPDAKRVYDFETIAATFGYSLGVGALPIHRVQMKADRRAAYGTGKRVRDIEVPKEVHITPRMYQKLTEKIAGKPEERILSYLMLRSLKQARYSEESLGHFALAATSYTHFTSPIRRYPDLIVHRILKSVLRDGDSHPISAKGAEIRVEQPRVMVGQPTAEEKASQWSKRRETTVTHALGGPISLEELHEIAEESSTAERRADEAERELMEWKKVKFMQERVGEDFDGLITSVTKFGFFVELTDLFVEGLVPLNTLIDDRYTYHENTREIIGQRSRKIYRIGQRLRVLVDRIDPVEKKIQFAVVEERPVKKTGGKKRK